MRTQYSHSKPYAILIRFKKNLWAQTGLFKKWIYDLGLGVGRSVKINSYWRRWESGEQPKPTRVTSLESHKRNTLRKRHLGHGSETRRKGGEWVTEEASKKRWRPPSLALPSQIFHPDLLVLGTMLLWWYNWWNVKSVLKTWSLVLLKCCHCFFLHL